MTARAVLDTQIVLDWLLFNDPSVQPLAAQIAAGALEWVAEPGGLDELRHVLGREALARYQPDVAAIDAAIAAQCRVVATPQLPPHGLVCRDRDDQRFIDLALAIGATYLFSRDRAVLALARPARARGLTIVSPARWVVPAVALPG